MYQQHPEVHNLAAQDRYQAMLSESANERLLRSIPSNQNKYMQAVASYIGKLMVRIGARLLKYGRLRASSHPVQRSIHIA
jgi:hypothetical protein